MSRSERLEGLSDAEIMTAWEDHKIIFLNQELSTEVETLNFISDRLVEVDGDQLAEDIVNDLLGEMVEQIQKFRVISPLVMENYDLLVSNLRCSLNPDHQKALDKLKQRIARTSLYEVLDPIHKPK